MHDLVHDFAFFLTRNEIVVKEIDYPNSKIDISSEQARHLAVILAKGISFPTSIYGAEKLRSLMTFSGKDAITEEALRALFKQAKSLRVLDISWPDISGGHLNGSVPEEIGTLIHLRHLNLSQAWKLKRLPESLCKLHNLQYLDLKFCRSLEKLPDGFGNLINLTYLRTAGCNKITYYPKVIGRFTKLSCLHGVIVRADRNDPNEFSLGDLENLDQLHILGMKLVGDAIDAGEARRARLERKTRLEVFRIHYEWHLDVKEVSKVLNPPPYLEAEFKWD